MNNCLRSLALVSLFLLPACGFSPLYGTHGKGGAPTAVQLQNVAIENIADRDGQTLRNHLIDRMYSKGRPSQPTARLTVSLRSLESDLGIQKDATATRKQLSLWADYVLNDMSGHRLAGGTAHSVVSYSRLEAQYGTLAAQRNAYDRAIKEVGEQIVNRLSLYYAESED